MFTEVLKDINWMAVLVGALGYFFLGAIWYSFLFKEKWISYNPVVVDSPDAKKGVGAIMFTSFIVMFIVATGLATLADYIGLTGWVYGVKLGLITSISFSLTSMGINMLYEKKPLGLFLINGSYQVIGTVIASVVICCWK